MPIMFDSIDIWTGPGRAAVFLDRDGTINHEVEYLGSPDKLALLPGAAAAIARLNQADIPVIVVTNQSGIARGYYNEADLHAVHARLDELLAQQKASVTGYYYCPHHVEAQVPAYRVDCECRKPRTGMLSAAAAQENIALGQSFLVGDKLSDVDAARNAGCRPILVRTGYGRKAEAKLLQLADASGQPPRVPVVDTLSDAIQHVLAAMGHPQAQAA